MENSEKSLFYGLRCDRVLRGHRLSSLSLGIQVPSPITLRLTNYPHLLPTFPKLVKKVQLFESAAVPRMLLEPAVPTESLLKPRLSMIIENADPCDIPTSMAISSMVTLRSYSTRFCTREIFS
nr:hypothetical protein HmN_000505400 [Hymenolepis microstoma]